MAVRSAMDEANVKLDEKLIQLLEKQLIFAENQTTSKSVEKTTKPDETDHSLMLKVADEITRMQKNINRMEDGTKGLKGVKKGLERLRNNFLVNDYEIIDLLGKKYNERMNMEIVNVVIDEELSEDDKIINKVIRPQVNFKGKLIQRAQVEISTN